MKKWALFVLMFFLAAGPALAAPKMDKAHGAPDKGDKAVERVGDEIADAVADVLTGEDKSASPKGSMPPGLAKKGKTPPGWSKGEKTGWDEKVTTNEDSPISKFFRKILGDVRDRS